MHKYIIHLLLFLTINKSVGQINDKFQINFGASYSTQQVKWFEEQQNQTNPFVLNSPNWRLLYNFGVNYKIYSYGNIDINTGLKYQEKGSKNMFYNPFYPYYFERKYEVTKFLMVTGSFIYKINNNISIFAECTFGREILKPFPSYNNEFAIIHGLQCRLFKNIGFSVGYNQGITSLKQNVPNINARNISFDSNLTYNF